MAHNNYIEGSNSYRGAYLGNGITLHYSYDSLVAVGIDGTTFVNEKYHNYSTTTSKHIQTLQNRVYISTQLFEDTIKICLPEPPAQIKPWLLERSRRGVVGTPS
jgi:hypothetical protein